MIKHKPETEASDFDQAIDIASAFLEADNWLDLDGERAAILSREFLRALERAAILDQALGDEIASQPYTHPAMAHAERIRAAARKLRPVMGEKPPLCRSCLGTGEVRYTATSYGPCPECRKEIIDVHPSKT